MDISIAELVGLLEADDSAPEGVYLVELRVGLYLFWHVSNGGPSDAALDPALDWMLLPA